MEIDAWADVDLISNDGNWRGAVASTIPAFLAHTFSSLHMEAAAEHDQLCGVNEESGGDAFFQTVSAQIADFLANEHEVARCAFVNPTLTRHDLSFHLWWRVIKINRHEALPR